MNRSTPPTDAADAAARPDPLDAVLRAWPDGPSAAGARDTALAAILSRLDAPLSDASSRTDDEQLLVAPMAEERDESAPSQPPVSLDGKSRRERRTFQDIAKLAGPPSSKAAAAVDEWKEDSGVVDLKVPAAEPEVTKPVLGAAPSAPTSVPPSAAAAAAPAAVASVAAAAAPAATPPAPVAPTTSTPAAAVAAPMARKTEEKKGSTGIVIGLFAAAAVAAGVFFVAKGKPEEKKTETPVAAAPTETAKAGEPAAKPEEKKADPGTSALSPEALAAAEKAKAATPTAGGAAPATTGAAATPGAATTGTAKPEEKKPEIPVGEPGSLTAAMAQAAGPIDTSKTTTTAQTGPVGNVPQRPSQGAVTGAMGKVLSAARACVTDDSASKATVTFAPSGAASGVSVSGPAAGTGAEGCIKAALMRANVGAFAESTYSTTVTIRH